jgi:hypothetical protein
MSAGMEQTHMEAVRFVPGVRAYQLVGKLLEIEAREARPA